MLRAIEKEDEVKKAQEGFKKALNRYWDESFKGKVGHLGNSWETTIHWSKELGIWAAFQTEHNRYWNGFGIGEPSRNSSNSIVAEINPPLKGIKRNIAGVFAKDDRGNIIICHRGKIGGGKKGIGKTLFMDNYRNELAALDENEEQAEVALVAELKSARLGYQIREFILEVERIKGLAGKAVSKPKAQKPLAGFSSEFAGEKHATINKRITFNCDHGIIANELARALESQNLSIGNDRNRDLYVLDKEGNIQTLFEVKTDTGTGSLYSGVGQLLLNSFQLEKRPKMVLAIPEQLPLNIEEGLKSIGIECLAYKLETKGVKFNKLERFY